MLTFITGKLLTTPSRLLKLILSLTTMDRNTDRKDIESLALLVHPQQPLSYLERLIQSELPSIKIENGAEKIPSISFRAQQADEDVIKPRTKTADEAKEDEEDSPDDQGADKSSQLGDGGVASYSGERREATSEDKDYPFVRWSSSTEIGDFIRDAARERNSRLRSKARRMSYESQSLHSMIESTISE